MTVIRGGEDCGNSPKNIFLRDLTIAFARGDAKDILDRVTEDILWNFAGRRTIRGKQDFAAALEQMKNDPVVEITIRHVVSHGKAGAVNGTRKLESGTNTAFCDVYEFSSAKGTSVREITSYVIEAG